MQEYYSRIRELDAEVVALSADTPGLVRQMVLEKNLTFPALSDQFREFIRAYDVLHPQEGISRPAMFIVDREGEIRWQYVGLGPSDRPPIETIIRQLEMLQ